MKKKILLCLFFVNFSFPECCYSHLLEIDSEQTLYSFHCTYPPNKFVSNISPLKNIANNHIQKTFLNKKVLAEKNQIDNFYKKNSSDLNVSGKTIIYEKMAEKPLLKCVDLSGLDLSNFNFSEQIFIRCKFNRSLAVNSSFCKADIAEAEMMEANFEGADFTEACLFGARMVRIILKNSKLNRTDLRKAIMYQGNLSGASFVGADLSGADMRFSKLRNANFTNANLAKANFTGSDMENTNFSGAYLKKTVWNDGKIYD